MGDAARELFMRRFTVDAMANGLLDVVRKYSARAVSAPYPRSTIV
jgi:hypothetical protein